MKLSTLFIVIGLIALLCGILFMMPLFIAGAFCLITIMITPAIWLTGSLFAKGVWRAFFIGGMFNGFVPHVCALYYGMILSASTGAEVFEKGISLGVASEELLAYRLTIAGIWFIPGIFAFSGGVVSMITYQFVCGRQQPVAQVVKQPPSVPSQEIDSL